MSNSFLNFIFDRESTGNKKIKELETICSDLLAENRRLIESRKDLEKLCEDINDNNQELIDHCKELEDLCEDFLTQIKQKESEIEQLEEKNAELINSITDKDIKINELTNQNDELQFDKKRIEFKYNQIENNYATLNGYYQTLINERDKYKLFRQRKINSYNEGIRPDLGDITFRSSWEANVARILNHKNITYEYEKEIFELPENVTYLPDFFFDDNTILEVKGFWDIESVKKVDLFIRTKPEYKYYLVDADMYFHLYEIYSKYNPLNQWEFHSVAQKVKVNIAVVGLPYYEIESVSKLSVGDSLIIEREPDNKIDKFAIKVLTKDGKAIGHIEKSFAAIYSIKMDMGMTYDVTISKIKNNAIIVDITRNNPDEVIAYDFLLP